ncbi:hypothetical protein [Streptomyces sp. SYP-A7185]|uniref:hypothetical protein n=1 Tax=Streptomyces sp. SYP-A7185 TaxID=3040076 RepID=UPI0038F69940
MIVNSWTEQLIPQVFGALAALTLRPYCRSRSSCPAYTGPTAHPFPYWAHLVDTQIQACVDGNA